MPLLPLLHRPRRNRRHPALRAWAREAELRADRLILPLFVHDVPGTSPIPSMPGCQRLDIEALLGEVHGALTDGVGAVALFPKVDGARKDPTGREASNPDGLIPRAVRRLKAEFPHLLVVTDVALDPYNSDGHDGIVSRAGVVLNDDTVASLCEQALTQARAGADLVAPSDMMDGRVGAVRAALDAEGYVEVGILAYTAKYASALYGPFRDALDSAPRALDHVPRDKRTYQMDPANQREALRELELDELEGADLVMVKPAGFYLDVVARVRDATTLPVAAYQVSGEFAMIHAAAANGWLDLRSVALESLTAIRRAGADVILTYFARDAARWLREG